MGPGYTTKQVYGTGFIINVTCNLFKIDYIKYMDALGVHFINCLNKEVK